MCGNHCAALWQSHSAMSKKKERGFEDGDGMFVIWSKAKLCVFLIQSCYFVEPIYYIVLTIFLLLQSRFFSVTPLFFLFFSFSGGPT